MTRRILLTAFEPFGGEAINPAQQIAEALSRRAFDGFSLDVLTLPVVFLRAAEPAIEALNRAHYDAVLMLGQAGGRSGISVERVAINLDDASRPDNDGDCPEDRPILPGGANACFATLPVKAIVRALRDAGLPASLSYSAGTYVCNHVMYRVLHHLLEDDVPAGFIHVPYLPEQVADRPGVPSMPLADMIRAVEIALDAIAASKECAASAKYGAFLKIAGALNERLRIVPLLYGSLGLERRLHAHLDADDIDVLIPEAFLNGEWERVVAVMNENGYVLRDLHEHEFEKSGLRLAFGSIDSLPSFAGVDPARIPAIEDANVRYYLLDLLDYLKVYTASSRDGYRKTVRNKQDEQKIKWINDAINRAAQ